MTDNIQTQLTLQTWMSAAFPTGAYTCSHGMETAIADGRIRDADSCEDWIDGVLNYGSGWNDAVIMHHAYTAVGTAADKPENLIDNDSKHRQRELAATLTTLNELALALCSGAERLRETTQLGDAFARAVAATIKTQTEMTSLVEGDITLPVCIGTSGALAAIPAEQLIPASLQATSSNLVWIATRLIPLGQTQALRIITNLQPLISSLGLRALRSTLDDLGTCALLADLASIEHEQLHSRICIT